MIKKSVIFIIFCLITSYLVNYFIVEEQKHSGMLYSGWKTANNALNLSGKRVLVVGGTQGIGAGVAIRFSQLGSSVVIAGRNETLANEVISKMKAESKISSQEFHFLKVDASLLRDLDRFTKETAEYFQSKGGRIDFIVQSQGILNGPLTITSEGHDRAFMINGYSKWFITKKLQPMLQESSVYICAPAKSGGINLDDVELKNSSRLPGVPGHRDAVFLDSMVTEFQSRYPSKRFYHIFPGLVDTEIFQNSNFNIISKIMPALKFLAKGLMRSNVEFADLPVFMATQDKNGGVSMSEKAKVYPAYDWIQNPENRAKLWEWSENLEKELN